MKLHALVGCPFCIRVMFAFHALELDFELVMYSTNVELKSEAFLEMNPRGEAPVLETSEGIIYESSAVMRYIGNLRPEIGINGKSLYERAIVDQWMLNTGNAFGAFIPAIVGQMGKVPKTKEDVENCIKQIPKAFELFENHLAERTYLVGNSVTNADFCFLSALFLLFNYVLEERERHKLPHTLRYYNNLSSSSFFTAYFGNNRRLCNKPWPVAPPQAVEVKKDAKAK